MVLLICVAGVGFTLLIAQRVPRVRERLTFGLSWLLVGGAVGTLRTLARLRS